MRRSRYLQHSVYGTAVFQNTRQKLVLKEIYKGKKPWKQTNLEYVKRIIKESTNFPPLPKEAIHYVYIFVLLQFVMELGGEKRKNSNKERLKKAGSYCEHKGKENME